MSRCSPYIPKSLVQITEKSYTISIGKLYVVEEQLINRMQSASWDIVRGVWFAKNDFGSVFGSA